MEFAQKIVVRGGGDLATGVVQKFHRAGFPVVILEVPAPTAIRRGVALCEAAYDGLAKVEDVTCRKVSAPAQLEDCWKTGQVPMLIDPKGETIREVAPCGVIDAIIAKQGTGTNMGMAGVTIALGPGFLAGKDVHAVIETMRGHDLGRLILEGTALPNTGLPGEIGGKSDERVLRAPADGVLRAGKQIGEIAKQGEVVFTVGGAAVRSPFTGLVRGILRDDALVVKDMKAADIDPRLDINAFTISDKARSLGGAALEAYLYLRNQSGEAIQ